MIIIKSYYKPNSIFIHDKTQKKLLQAKSSIFIHDKTQKCASSLTNLNPNHNNHRKTHVSMRIKEKKIENGKTAKTKTARE